MNLFVMSRSSSAEPSAVVTDRFGRVSVRLAAPGAAGHEQQRSSPPTKSAQQADGATVHSAQVPVTFRERYAHQTVRVLEVAE